MSSSGGSGASGMADHPARVRREAVSASPGGPGLIAPSLWGLANAGRASTALPLQRVLALTTPFLWTWWACVPRGLGRPGQRRSCDSERRALDGLGLGIASGRDD